MAEESRQAMALKHPLRVRIFGLLDGRTLPTTVVSGEVEEESLSTVLYHLRVLESAGLIASDGTTRPVWSRA
jgi:DNA-binding transcriptional ArsR family regulator